MKASLVVISIATVALAISAYIIGGFSLVREGLLNAQVTSWRALPLLLAAFFMIGQLQVLVSKEMMNRLLQKFAGLKGILFGAFAGGFFPGPPYVYYPFLESFKKEKIPFYLFLSFLTGKHVYDFGRFPMEISLINPGIALLRNVITLPLPIFIGLLTRFFFPGGMDDYFRQKGEE